MINDFALYRCDGQRSLNIVKTPPREKKKSLQDSWTTVGTDDSLSPLSCDASPGTEFGFLTHSPSESMSKSPITKRAVGMLPLLVMEEECVDPEQIKCLIENGGFIVGLARILASHSQSFSERIWLLDNSGSMAIGDGFRIVETVGRRTEGQRCTRWEELFETVLHHAEIASILQLPTEFRLLNYPGERAAGLLGEEYEFQVGVPGADKAHEIRVARSVMQRTKPTGFTPLAERLHQVQEKIRKKADECYAQGKRVALVIATDGLLTDSAGNETKQARDDFVVALKEMEDLPVWLVIRLCTDEIKVRDFYNGLDCELELSMDVLDDHAGEAREVARQNKWLNYGLPLQRCRELGCSERLFDFIDERPLGKAEIRTFCANLFGLNVRSLPDPNDSWREFVKAIEKELALHQEQWDPIKEKMAPWINIRNFKKKTEEVVVSFLGDESNESDSVELWFIYYMFMHIYK